MSSSPFRHLVRDTLAIANSFLDFSFSHIVKQGNVVAHALVQIARLFFPLLV